MFATQDITCGQLNALVKNLMKATCISDPHELVRSVNAGEWKLSRATKMTLTVPSSLSFADRIAFGAYNWGNEEGIEVLYSHDPMTVGEWEYDLYRPIRSISLNDALRGAEVDGWTLAKAEHLLAFGAQFPKKQREFPIIIFGPVCQSRGVRHELVLCCLEGRRGISMNRSSTDIESNPHFLRVRKVSAT